MLIWLLQETVTKMRGSLGRWLKSLCGLKMCSLIKGDEDTCMQQEAVGQLGRQCGEHAEKTHAG